MVEIARIKKAMERRGFLDRILTPMEREHCVTPAQVAGRWAAKEAIYKAVGLPLHWQQVEVLPDELGVPAVSINSQHFDPGRIRVQVSITHERQFAIAVAIVERKVFQAPSP
jgi:holo-[acyl-carrier protein] synthase